ncbi:MAG TPA: hypothetical protein VF741_09785, partial [Candidatus Aquilonibacter sp.]
MTILTLNLGSSSLKIAAYRGDSPEALAVVYAETLTPSRDADETLRQVLVRAGDDISAVGHRMVFGGARHDAPAPADAAILHDLEQLVEIEPLHLRAELDLVYATMRALPGVANVLCFDTAFHRRSPAIAHRLPLPPDLDPMLERYGFHGLSYEYIVSKLPPNAGRTVIAHLGSGASLCAVRDGRPVDTTMGFTALGGLMMGTRPGDLDPGVLLRLLGHDGYSAELLSDLLYHGSGLFGVSGTSADVRALLAQSPSNPRARDAIELFMYQLVKHVGAMVAVLGGLDVLVFTGGIGEHQSLIRERIVAALAYAGT